MSWVYGDSLKDYTIGFFVLDPEAMAKYCLQNDRVYDEKLLEDDSFRKLVYADLMSLAKANGLNSLEKPKQF